MDSKDTSVEKNGCIYLVTCLENGKTYIGQYAYENPTGRYTRHWAPNQKDTCIFHRALWKYGKDAFKLETLGIFPRSSLNNMEAYYAEQFQSYMWDTNEEASIPGGYNMMLCGQMNRQGMKHTPEALAKMSACVKGRKHSEETKRKIPSCDDRQLAVHWRSCQAVPTVKRETLGSMFSAHSNPGQLRRLKQPPSPVFAFAQCRFACLAGFCMSQRNMMRLFGAATGTTPVNYLLHLRIYQATIMLRSSRQSINEIAEQCGFSDSNYFTRQFHRLTCKTPSAYRETIRPASKVKPL